MSWELIFTEDTKLILDLYQAVFDEKLSKEDLKKYTDGFNIHLFTIQRSGESPAGFGIYRGLGNDVELWRADVLPDRRRQGAGSRLLEYGKPPGMT